MPGSFYSYRVCVPLCRACVLSCVCATTLYLCVDEGNADKIEVEHGATVRPKIKDVFLQFYQQVVGRDQAAVACIVDSLSKNKKNKQKPPMSHHCAHTTCPHRCTGNAVE